MSKVMQNLVVLMEPTDASIMKPSNVPLKAGNMIFNRFCIDEDAAFELSGVNYLKKADTSRERGKEDSFLRSDFILRNGSR